MSTSELFNPDTPKTTTVPESEFQAFFQSMEAGVPFTEILYQYLQRNDGGEWDGIGYALTKDNLLPKNWLQQTPNVWGQSADKVQKGAGIFVAKNVQAMITGATQFIDITSLYPYPDGQFYTAIQNGLIALANSGQAVTVRILVGQDVIDHGQNQSKFLKGLIKPLQSIATGKLQIYVGAQRTKEWSWNHAKIVAVDGQVALLGGENLWDEDYLEDEPVHDLNVMIQGSLVYYMHKFTDTTWKNVCGYIEPDWWSVYWQSGAKDISYACLDTSLAKPTPGPGTLSILGAGRYGSLGNGLNDPGDYALQASLSVANSVIRIAQQDLVTSEGPVYKTWELGMIEIAKALIRNVDVYIVLTNDDAKAGSGRGYSSSTVRKTADVIRKYVSEQPDAPIGQALIKLLCSKLHLSTLRFGPSDTWPNGYEFANHSKFLMVDDLVFYVGSENFYPADLIEYGIFISDPVAVKEIQTQYWDQLWNNSKRVAISGPEAATCYFQG
jgi:phosphatidylserine/phosphatidylglycerophosphate/cardiolipin synthase-like enzyme